jgi:hypothetical protein
LNFRNDCPLSMFLVLQLNTCICHSLKNRKCSYRKLFDALSSHHYGFYVLFCLFLLRTNLAICRFFHFYLKRNKRIDILEKFTPFNCFFFYLASCFCCVLNKFIDNPDIKEDNQIFFCLSFFLKFIYCKT